MNQEDYEEIVAQLLDIKHVLQKGKAFNINDLLNKVDRCITKLTSYVNHIPINANSNQPRIARSMIVSSYSEENPIDSSKLNVGGRKSAGEEVQKFKNSLTQPKVKEEDSVLQDYFVLRYNLAYNDYEVYGRPGVNSDRRVYIDLLTFDNKRSHTERLQKTESMTNILRQVYSQPKPSLPFVLPSYLQNQQRYLFVFSLPECASIANEYYRAQTICCFVSRQFILGELMQLMGQISRVIFEQQVKETSETEELAKTISLLHGKKTYQSMEKIILKFLNKRNELTSSKLFNTKIEKPLVRSIEDYLAGTSESWSLVKKGRDQELIMSLVLLYYLAICQYKIVLLANTQNKHLISELILGLVRALNPLTYTYPIVGATITQHHFEFANSPVPIIVGLWGSPRDYTAAKNGLKRMVSAHNKMSASELASETLMAVVDLEEHSLLFMEGAFKQTCRLCKKIQSHIESQTMEMTCVKLSYLTQQLIDGSREEDWMLQLAKEIKVSQMYDFYKYKQ